MSEIQDGMHTERFLTAASARESEEPLWLFFLPFPLLMIYQAIRRVVQWFC